MTPPSCFGGSGRLLDRLVDARPRTETGFAAAEPLDDPFHVGPVGRSRARPLQRVQGFAAQPGIGQQAGASFRSDDFGAVKVEGVPGFPGRLLLILADDERLCGEAFDLDLQFNLQHFVVLLWQIGAPGGNRTRFLSV